MSSRQGKPQPLSEADIQRIAEQIDAGNQPSIWFTAAAVGVTEGKSGKVVALGDRAEGDFLQVRATGSKDVLSFSPTEVTLTKPPPKRATKAAPEAPPVAPTPTVLPAGPASPGTPSVGSRSVPTPPASPASGSPAPASTARASTASGSTPVASSSGSTARASTASASAASERPARGSAGQRKAKQPEITVTLSGTADGEWVVDVVAGKKRAIRALPVLGSAVAQAAKALDPEVAEAIESVLEAARGAQRAKVEQLQAELAAARQLLDDLSE